MGFHTFSAGEVLTAANVNTYLMNQVVIVCTSGTRPSSPTAGMVIYETDTSKFQAYDGTGWRLLLTLSTNGAIHTITAAAQLNWTTSQSTATAGTNGATPAQVSGYIQIAVGGTTQKVPFYNV